MPAEKKKYLVNLHLHLHQLNFGRIFSMVQCSYEKSNDQNNVLKNKKENSFLEKVIAVILKHKNYQNVAIYCFIFYSMSYFIKYVKSF